MLIFDAFSTRDNADKFAERVRSLYPNRTATVFDSEEAAQESDPFPFMLFAPIVHVSRSMDLTDEDAAEEDAIEELVEEFGGTFAGT